MSKRFTALLMALVLVVGILAVPAMAVTGGMVSPHACTHPRQTSGPISWTSGWHTTTSYSCVHGYGGADERQTRTGKKKHACLDCGYTYFTEEVENRIFCRPQNMVCSLDHEIM